MEVLNADPHIKGAAIICSDYNLVNLKINECIHNAWTKADKASIFISSSTNVISLFLTEISEELNRVVYRLGRSMSVDVSVHLTYIWSPSYTKMSLERKIFKTGQNEGNEGGSAEDWCTCDHGESRADQRGEGQDGHPILWPNGEQTHLPCKPSSPLHSMLHSCQCTDAFLFSFCFSLMIFYWSLPLPD